MRTVLLAMLAVLLALALTAILILLGGKNPLLAYAALLGGAVGSLDRIAFALNRCTPTMLAAVGVALCFRANVINIGAEGQIAVGGLAAAGLALALPFLPSVLLIPTALIAGAAAGVLWSALAAAIRLERGVHEVVCTLLLNFVGILLVSEALQGPMGEIGAGFPQSPMLAEAAWLPKLLAGTDLHIGILIAVAAVILGHLLLWHTPLGFRLRLIGGSRSAASYAGLSYAKNVFGVMALAGALAGLAGGIEVLGVQYRLIEGFSTGFGFTAVAIALLAALNPLAVLPAGLFFGFLQAGALSMQRQVGVPSSLVYADHMVSGLAVNILALGLTSFLLRALFHGRAPIIRLATLPPLPIPGLAGLPLIGPVLFAQPALTYLALLLTLALHLFLMRTRTGLTLRAVGENPEAAFAVGTDPIRVRMAAIIAGGAIAGLGGAVLALQEVDTFTDGMTNGRGFIALAAIIVGRWMPFGALLACLLFGATTAVELRIEALGMPVSSYVIQMMPYLMALAVLAGIGRGTRMPNALGRPFAAG